MAYSYSSRPRGGYGGDAFSQADLNQDGIVDRGEFQNFVAGNSLGHGDAWNTGYDASYAGGGIASSGTIYDAGYAGGLYGGASSGLTTYDAGYAANGVYGGGVNYGATAVNYAANAQAVYQDPNPQIIRRPAVGGPATYQQNIRLRFLQPPPVPPPGPIFIREVRPPQPPPPPPLRITQRSPPYPVPPPLLLRERPPVPPRYIPGRTVLRPLPGIPVPPRSVIIDRFSPLPPRPRDIFIERWLRYGPQGKQRSLLHPAPPAARYTQPRNVIVQYDQAPARVVRRFQFLGVTPYNPAAYVQQYGGSLLDAATLVSIARAAGVVEDITPPGVVGYSSAVYGQQGSYGYGSSLVNAGSYGTGLRGGSLTGSYVDGGWNGGYYGGTGLSGAYYGGVGGGLLNNLSEAAFTAGDLDHSGTLDRAEFNNLLTGGGIDGYLPTPW